MSGVIVNQAEDFKSKSNVGVLKDLFSGNTKRKPIDVKINNDIRKEPRIGLLKNAKFSEEQRFRRYKSKIEPRLKEKITMNEDDDIVARLKDIFGIKAPDTKPIETKEEKEVPITINSETTDELPERPKTGTFVSIYKDWVGSGKKGSSDEISLLSDKDISELSGMAKKDEKTESAVALQRLFRNRPNLDSPAHSLSTPDSTRATPLVLTESRDVVLGAAKVFRKELEGDLFPDSLAGADTPTPAPRSRGKGGRTPGSLNKKTLGLTEGFVGV